MIFRNPQTCFFSKNQETNACEFQLSYSPSSSSVSSTTSRALLELLDAGVDPRGGRVAEALGASTLSFFAGGFEGAGFALTTTPFFGGAGGTLGGLPMGESHWSSSGAEGFRLIYLGLNQTAAGIKSGQNFPNPLPRNHACHE